MGSKSLPNFLIVGAAKAGTTTLYNYLQKNPNIFVPEHKEPYFLTGQSLAEINTNGGYYHRGMIDNFELYCDLYKNAYLKMMIGDFSTGYLYFYQSSIYNIKKYLGSPKIIIIIRNPVDRAYSNYLHHVKDGNETESFEDAISLIEERKKKNWWWGYSLLDAGLYYNQVKAYLENFTDVKIFLFEDLKNNSQFVVDDLCSFLNVSSFDIENKIYNKSGVPKKNTKTFLYRRLVGSNNFLVKSFLSLIPLSFKNKLREIITEKLLNTNLEKPQMKKETRIELQKYYKEDILKLQDLIKRDLSDWLK